MFIRNTVCAYGVTDMIHVDILKTLLNVHISRSLWRGEGETADDVSSLYNYQTSIGQKDLVKSSSVNNHAGNLVYSKIAARPYWLIFEGFDINHSLIRPKLERVPAEEL